jgi:hypothetical protein
MRGLWSTLALVLVLAGLGAYIYFVESENPAPGLEPKDKVFTVESGQIEELRVTAQGETAVLVKKGEGWQMTEPVAADADPTEASSFATNLSSLEVNRVVDENAPDLAPYGLAEPRITVAFKAQGGTSGEVHLGEKTPTGGDIYAVKPGEKRVFLVSSYLETTFNKKPFDLRDKRIVKFERDKVETVEVARGAESIRLKRAGSDWTIEAPAPGRGDYATVEGLLTRMSTAAMAAIVEPEAKDLAKYGLDKPAMTITLGAGSSQTILDVGRTEGEQRYAKDRSRPMVFTLDTTLGDDLTKALDDYRSKELFVSRSYNTDRLQLTRLEGKETRTYDFEKTTSDQGDKWRVTPSGGEARDVDRAKADDLLTKLAAARITSFAAPSTRTGLDTPLLTVGVSYDGGKFERVRFAQQASLHYGSREGEQAGVVASATVTDVLTALDATLAPPAPPTEEKK